MSNPVYDNLPFYLGTSTPAEPDYAGGGGGGSTTVNVNAVDFEMVSDDTLNDGTVLVPFMRKYTTPSTGITVATDFELDGVTPYAVVGTVVPTGAVATNTLEQITTLVREYVGPVTVTSASLLADMGKTSLLEVDVIVRQLAVVGGVVEISSDGGANNVTLPLGSSVTMRALDGYKLDNLQFVLETDEAVNITAQAA